MADASVLLISSWANTPQVRGWYLSPPMGLYRIQNWLCDRHTVDILDPAIINPIDYLRSNRYQVYGFSPTQDNIANDVALMRFVRQQYPEASIIIGGNEATFNYQWYLDRQLVDAVIIGEGEKALAGFLAKAAGRNLPPSTILAPLSAETVLSSSDLARASMLDFSRFPIRDYWQNNALLPDIVNDDLYCVTLYLTNYCPAGCRFCSSTRFIRTACPPHSRVQAIPADAIVALIHSVKSQLPETRTIYFHDDNACYYREATISWCRRLAADNPGVSFVASSRIDHFDADLLHTMKKAGFRKISCGIEAYSDKLLRRIRKNITRAQIDAFVSLAAEAGLALHLNTMLCQPEAELRDVTATAEFCLRMLEHPHHTVTAELYTKAYPGSWYFDNWPLIEYAMVTGPELPGIPAANYRIPQRFLPGDPAVQRLLLRVDESLRSDTQVTALCTSHFHKHQLTRTICERVLSLA